MQPWGWRFGTAVVCTAVLSGAALTTTTPPAAVAASSPRRSGLTAVSVGGRTFLVRPHGRAGVKSVAPGVRPPSNQTLAVQSSARKVS
jgi:hypothetical protein